MSGSEYIKREEGNVCTFEVTPASSPKFWLMVIGGGVLSLLGLGTGGILGWIIFLPIGALGIWIGYFKDIRPAAHRVSNKFRVSPSAIEANGHTFAKDDIHRRGGVLNLGVECPKNGLPLALLAAIIGSHAPIAAGQDAPKKTSLWQQMKDAAKQAQQQATLQTPAQSQRQLDAQVDPASGKTEAQNTAAPSIPPTDDYNAVPVKLDPTKMPDVVGVRLGMTAAESLAATRKQYPTDIYQKLTATGWPDTQKPDIGFTVLSSAPGNDVDVHLSFTAPPGPQLVWRITRFTSHMNINHSTLLAALRAKYGKESLALPNNSYEATTDDKQIDQMYWLFNERGERVPLPPSTAFANGRGIMECWGINPQPNMPTDDEDLQKRVFLKWCSSMVGLHVRTTTEEIVPFTFTEMIDVPLGIRTARAAKIWQANVAEEQRKKAIQKSKTVTPTL